MRKRPSAHNIRLELKTVIDNRGGHRRSSFGVPRDNYQGNEQTITIRIPLSVKQRSRRKLVVVPPNAPTLVPRRSHIDDTLIKALARAHRWRRMLDHCEHSSMTELARVENVTESYLCRILRLTLLSPKVIEAILDGRPNNIPELQQLIRPFPTEWQIQEAAWLISGSKKRRQPTCDPASTS